MKDTRISLTSAGACAHASARKQARKLNVLIACEESQTECAAFRALGHNAYSCDIQPCRRGGNPYWHIHGDVTPLLHGDTAFNVQAGFLRCVSRWDLIIAHPPCTYLSKIGCPWMHKDEDAEVCLDGKMVRVNFDRYMKMCSGRDFFFECLNAQAPFVAVENPIPMKLAQLPKPTTFIDPSWFGVKYTKKTLFWLKNLPPILPERFFPNPKCYVTSSRGKYRSRTFPQVAAAIAKQWSEYILSTDSNITI